MSQLSQARSAPFSELLRNFRLAAGLSQEELAERAGMSAAGISVLERGIRRAPHRDTVQLLAKGLSLAPDDRQLLEGAAVRPSQPRRRRAEGGDDPLEPIAHNLPIELTSFIGRELDVERLRALLERSRLVTIVGTGGVGKTRTAVRVAQTQVGTVDAGVWFVDLSPLSDASSVAAAVMNVVGAAQRPNATPLENLVAFVGSRDPLIVLDNCEHLLNEAARVSEQLLRGGARVRILATSREPLKVSGERVYRLPVLPTQEAVALFISRAEAADHEFVLNDQDARVVGEICGRLDGIPLAIELAAARSGTIPMTTLAENLNRRLSILSDRGHVARHQTLRALIDWSYGLLQPNVQRLFERLSVFAGGTTLATAARVCSDDGADGGEVLEDLTLLIDKSLVVPDFDRDEPRYTLLESVRQFGREQLAQRGELAATQRRHALALVELAESYSRDWDVAPPPQWQELLQVELDNWRAVLEWALTARQDVQLGQQLVATLHHAWVGVALADSHHWPRVARELCDDRTPRLIVAQLDHVDAKIALRAGEVAVALERGQHALREFQKSGDPRQRAGALRVVADAMLMLGRTAEAERLFDETLALTRDAGLRWRTAFVLQSMARLSALSGRIDEARDRFRESLEILRALGDDEGVGIALNNLSEVEFRAGDAPTALRLAEEALSFRLRTRGAQVRSVPNLPAYLIALDRFEEAFQHVREVLRYAGQQQHHMQFLWPLQHFVAASALMVPSTEQRAFDVYPDAARVLGFIDLELSSLGATREYIEQDQYDRLLRRLREVLDLETLARCMADGAALTGTTAMELAENMIGGPKGVEEPI